MTAPHVEGAETSFPAVKMTAYVHSSLCMAVLHFSTLSPTLQLEFSFRLFYGSVGTDIEQVLREKKPFILRCMLAGIKKLQRRMVQWNRCALSVSITWA